MTSAQREYTYTILLDPDEIDGGYTVTVPGAARPRDAGRHV